MPFIMQQQLRGWQTPPSLETRSIICLLFFFSSYVALCCFFMLSSHPANGLEKTLLNIVYLLKRQDRELGLALSFHHSSLTGVSARHFSPKWQSSFHFSGLLTLLGRSPRVYILVLAPSGLVRSIVDAKSFFFFYFQDSLLRIDETHFPPRSTDLKSYFLHFFFTYFLPRGSRPPAKFSSQRPVLSGFSYDTLMIMIKSRKLKRKERKKKLDRVGISLRPTQNKILPN